MPLPSGEVASDSFIQVAYASSSDDEENTRRVVGIDDDDYNGLGYSDDTKDSSLRPHRRQGFASSLEISKSASWMGLVSKERDDDLEGPSHRAFAARQQGLPWWRRSSYQMGGVGLLATILLLVMFVSSSPQNSLPRAMFGSGGKLDTIVYLNTTEGISLLMGNPEYAMDYYRLEHGFDAQINQAYCAVASAVAVLNSLKETGLRLPVDYEYTPYAYATQVAIFNDCTNNRVVYHDESDEDAFDGILAMPFGMSLDQTRALLRCHLPNNDFTVTAHHADPSTMDVNQMRNDLKEALSIPNARVMVNFDRSSLGQPGGGHWSPVGSYVGGNVDAFLIMDVAKYKSPPFFVPASQLYESIATEDGCGVWNFPTAQGELSDDLLYPNSNTWNKAKQALGCESAYRGYIIVRPKS